MTKRAIILAMDRSPRAAGGRRLALDRKSVRRFDRDGRLHVMVTNISKASVDPYYGREIPGAEKLGLSPDRIYYLLRDPEELAKAAPTFNNLQLLSEHIPVDADEPQADLTVGSTGTDCVFEDGYLRNSLVVWDAQAIADIESEEKKELSSGYYYTADMTPGKFNGLRYDGVMRDIVGNHVALVDSGRAGPDVVVGDRKPEPLHMLKTRRALMLHGAMTALIAPKLAMDAKLDLTSAFATVTNKGRGKDGKAIAQRVVKLAKPKLAQDEGLDVEDVVKIINAVDGTAAAAEPAPVEDEEPYDDDGMVNDGDDALAKVMAFLEGKLSDEDMAALGELVGSAGSDNDADDDGVVEDEEPAPPPGGAAPKDTPAMDAAAIRKHAVREVAAIREAERAVAPFVGEVTVAMDSAADVYKLALDHAGVDLKGVHPSAYRSLVALLPKPGSDAPKPVMATDRKNAEADFASRFPTAGKLIPS